MPVLLVNCGTSFLSTSVCVVASPMKFNVEPAYGLPVAADEAAALDVGNIGPPPTRTSITAAVQSFSHRLRDVDVLITNSPSITCEARFRPAGRYLRP
jgi:hypothetical protein